jgi:uncharacterized protein YbaP (TraB family)
LGSLAFGRPNVFAAEQSTNTDALQEVLVTGERPGPGLWRVSKGDHDLWILGTLVPLPKKMIWRSRLVEMRIAASQVVIAPPQVDPDIGVFRAITLIPSILHARHSPDGRTLEKELPHDVYIRWLALRVKYLGHSDETVRPALAAFDLYSSALDQVGLAPDDDDVWNVVKRTADAHRVPIEHLNIKVRVDDPKAAIRGLGQIPREAEIACLENTMKRLETDLQPMVRRADLWSLGDIDGLRAMTIPDRDADCQGAFLAVPQLQNLASQADASTDSAWLAAADRALANHVSSFAVLDIAELLQPDGLLAKLRARGYAVEEPRTRNPPENTRQ